MPLRFIAAAIGLVGVAAFLVLGTQTAHAHGEFERSDPRPDAILGGAPHEVVVVLSEAVDPVLIEIRVYNAAGDRVDEGGTRQADNHSMVTSVGPLDSGIFTVAWEAISQADGHRSSDVFRFTVSGGGRLFLGTPASGISPVSDTSPAPGNTAVRWIELLGLALVVGGIGTALALHGPLAGHPVSGTGQRLQRRFSYQITTGLLLVGGALIAAPFVQPTGAGDFLRQGSVGWLLAVRLAITVLIGFVGYRSLMRGAGGKKTLWFLTGVALLLVLGRSIRSHAAASDGPLVGVAIASDFIHLASAALWVGGLAGLLLTLVAIPRGDKEVKASVIRRFSRLAMASVGAIAVTGLYNVWTNVESLRGLVDTPYGVLILAKTVVLGLALSIALFNLLGVQIGPFNMRRLAAATEDVFDKASKRLKLRVQGEVLLAIAILGLTAVLANLTPARDAAPPLGRAREAPAAMPVLSSERDMLVTLGVTPNRVGVNTLLLDVTDALGNFLEGDIQTSVRLSRLDRDLAQGPFSLERHSPGSFALRSDLLSIVGTWVAQIRVVPPGQEARLFDFLFRVASQPVSNRSASQRFLDFFSGREPDLPLTGPLVPEGPNAPTGHELLRASDASQNRLLSLQECNNISGAIFVLEYAAPDRARYATNEGGGSIISGDLQWYLQDGRRWDERTRINTFRFPDYDYAADAQGVRLEGVHQEGGRPHEVVSFYSGRDQADYWFWVDQETRTLTRLVMNLPPGHYMVSTFSPLERPQDVVAPSGPGDTFATLPHIPEHAACAKYLPSY